MKKISLFILLLFSFWSAQAQVVSPTNAQRANDPNKAVGEALKTTGTVSISVGVPCLAAGIGCLLYANLMKDPTAGYTTSQAVANQYADRTYISTEEYVKLLNGYYNKRNAASTAGYLLAPMGGALTIIGIPLYIKGDKMLKLNIHGDGAGMSVNF